MLYAYLCLYKLSFNSSKSYNFFLIRIANIWFLFKIQIIEVFSLNFFYSQKNRRRESNY